MTPTSSTINAETATVEPSGWNMQFDISVNDRHVKLLRWAVQVASDAVVNQSGDGGLPKEEAMLIIDQLGQMEDHIVDQVIEIADSSDSGWEQMVLPFEVP